VRRYTWELAIALASEFQQDQYWLLSDQMFTTPGPLPVNLQVGRKPETFLDRKWWLSGLNREMTRIGADVFHGVDFSVPYRPRRAGVMTLHDLSPWLEHRPEAARVRRRTPLLLRLGCAAMVITPSEAIRRAAIDRFGLNADRVVAVPLAASSTFRAVEVPPAHPYFLFIGTLEPRKNVARLIEAWREVRKHHDVDLVLAGAARADFAMPAPEPGLRVLGAVPEADLPGLYAGSLASVYPSLYEGFGLPVLEAMQCGAIVVTSRDPAIGEVCGEAAIRVDATDTKAWIEMLSAIAREPEKFQPLREQALARAREFTWSRTARLTREVYAAARRRFEA
jgi:glycosyltransferase involved in cell wall biosynthesis